MPRVADYISTMTRDWRLSVPSTPVLSVSNDGDGDAVTATVTGDSGVTNTLYYWKSGSAWTAGNSRTGDGTIAQTGLDDGSTYQFCVISSLDGNYSLPSSPYSLVVVDTSGIVTASGVLSLPLENMRTILAASANFQTWVGAASAAAAKASIYIAAAGSVSDNRPFAGVWYQVPLDWNSSTYGGGDRTHLYASGTLLLWFEASVATANQASSEYAEYAFLNDVSAFISDISLLSGSDGYLNITAITGTRGPSRAVVQEAEDYYLAEFAVEFGDL